MMLRIYTSEDGERFEAHSEGCISAPPDHYNVHEAIDIDVEDKDELETYFDLESPRCIIYADCVEGLPQRKEDL